MEILTVIVVGLICAAVVYANWAVYKRDKSLFSERHRDRSIDRSLSSHKSFYEGEKNREEEAN